METTQNELSSLSAAINLTNEEFQNGLKSEAEHREELSKIVEELQNEMLSFKDKMEKESLERRNSLDGFLRPQSGIGGVDRLSPMQLMMAMKVKETLTGAGELQEAWNGLNQRITEDLVDEHFAALEASDPDHALPITSPRRRFADAMRNAMHGEVMNALPDNSGVVAMAGAEMFPLLAAGSNVMPIIPVEPRLAGTGQVVCMVPFAHSDLIANRNPTEDITDTTLGGGGPVRLNAVEYNLLVKVADSHIQDYSFGDLILDAMAPSLRRAGYNLDEIILFGDTTAAAASNINRIAGGGTSTDYRTTFDGLGKTSIPAGSSSERNVDAATFNIESVLRAHGVLGQNYGVPYNDVYVAAPVATLNTLLNMNNVVQLQIGGSGEIDIGGPVRSLSGINFLPHDGTLKRDADGKVSNTPANNTHESAIMFNRNACLQGFSRPLSSVTRQAPQGMYQNLILDMRWAFAVGIIEAIVSMNNIG